MVHKGVQVERATVRTTWTPWAASARLCLGRRRTGWELPRADYRAAQGRRERGLPDPDDDQEGSTLVIAHWAYAGHGRTPGESWLAASIARDIETNRDTARGGHRTGA